MKTDSEKSKTKLQDNNKRPNLYIIRNIEEEINIGAQGVFEEIMAGNSPNLSSINLQTQEVESTPNRINLTKKKKIPRHTVVKLLKSKEKVLKAVRVK